MCITNSGLLRNPFHPIPNISPPENSGAVCRLRAVNLRKQTICHQPLGEVTLPSESLVRETKANIVLGYPPGAPRYISDSYFLPSISYYAQYKGIVCFSSVVIVIVIVVVVVAAAAAVVLLLLLLRVFRCCYWRCCCSCCCCCCCRFVVVNIAAVVVATVVTFPTAAIVIILFKVSQYRKCCPLVISVAEQVSVRQTCPQKCESVSDTRLSTYK